MRTMILGAMLLALACARRTSAPLDNARANLDAAKRTPTAQLAQSELAMAGRTLARANAELDQRGESGRISDLAYVTNRQIDLANTKARTEQLREKFVTASTEAEGLKATAAAEPLPPPPAPEPIADPEQPRMEVIEMPTPAPAPVKVTEPAKPAEPVRVSKTETPPIPDPYETPKQKLSSFAQSKEDKRGTVLTIPVALLFEPGVDGIGANGKPRIGELSAYLKDTTGPVAIEVHTDNTGSSADNQKLALSRADAIKALLVDLGVQEDRLTTSGIGDKKPLNGNATAEDRAANRRVEIVVPPQAQKPVSANETEPTPQS